MNFESETFRIFVVLMACGVVGTILFVVARFIVAIVFLAALSASWHRWSLLIAGNGSIRRWWNDGKDTKGQKIKAVAKSFFIMMPDLADVSEYSRGDSSWRGFGDWNVGSRRSKK